VVPALESVGPPPPRSSVVQNERFRKLSACRQGRDRIPIKGLFQEVLGGGGRGCPAPAPLHPGRGARQANDQGPRVGRRDLLDLVLRKPRKKMPAIPVVRVNPGRENEILRGEGAWPSCQVRFREAKTVGGLHRSIRGRRASCRY